MIREEDLRKLGIIDHCFVCKQQLTPQTKVVSLMWGETTNKTMAWSWSILWRKEIPVQIFIHVSCFERVAGDTYCLSESLKKEAKIA